VVSDYFNNNNNNNNKINKNIERRDREQMQALPPI
jgi:hypothetical protein